MTSMKIRRIDTSNPQAIRQLAALKNQFADQATTVTAANKKLTQAVFGEPLPPVKVVERICNDVQKKGLASLLHYTEAFDKVRLTPRQIRVSAEDLAAAYAAADPEFLDAARRIRDNVQQFQVGLMSNDALLPLSEHYELHLRHRPLRRVGICIPGGAAAYPSSLLMTVCPAQAAEVKEIVVVMPPTANGASNKDMLAICHLLGVKEVYRVGGAQAVAALAYGVDGIEPVDMIVGPGSIYVTLAKRLVFGTVAIDCLAGPSEIVVVADESAQPDFIALDMIAQAEHAPGVAMLVTWHDDLPNEVEKSLTKQLAHLERGNLARASLEEYGAFIVVKDRAEGVKMVNQLAPEHLHVQTRDPEAFAEKVDNAGAIFLGTFTPVALGDYAAGPSHVLPTGGTARFASGLTVNDFRRRTSIVNFTRAGLREIADDVITMANKEGLTAHAASVAARVTDKPLQLRPSKKAAAAAAKLKK
ncbi:MAG: histidinol dehydrogenase [Gemmataceae bacterium]|nr:histidinol dehydrogenase [Gemmataceae bacterium]